MESNKAKICVPVCVSANDFKAAVVHAGEIGELIELRMDCLSSDERQEALRDALALTRRSLILTLRPELEGGNSAVSLEDRRQFWSSIENFRDGVFFDLELDLIPTVLSNKAIDPSRVICSHHSLEGGIEDLDSLYERMSNTQAAVLKIALQANDAIDCLAIFKLLERAKDDSRDLIGIAMGSPGVATRILGPSRGSFLTYGSLDDESATAPGQLTARELREVYRIDRIDRQTQILGLIGRPVSHSISPQIHNAAFAASDLDAVFVPFEVRDIDAFMRRMVRETSREIDWNVRGFSVTAPYKAAVMSHLDWIEAAAKEIGAVNTIVAKDGQLLGYNTDAAAFLGTLETAVESAQDLRCATIGAGGAARAVNWALQNAGASVSVFARDPAKAKLIAGDFGINSYELAEAKFDEFDVVINATPLGTRGLHESATPVRAEQLRGVRLAYDLVYNPLETQFMREARAAGCQTIGGLEMLIRQAVEQFKLWTGEDPNVTTMRAVAEKGLARLSPNDS
ncbi:MAG TPA: shikimate dehydrogenase [Pyrinomonadaceae bacterium]|nr:shikimate dehydrogenase [Pyrinomonadaceae bacterium]